MTSSSLVLRITPGHRLGIPLATIYAWRAKGTGPKAIKVGKHLPYRRTDVDSWLNELASAASGSRTA